MIAMLCSLVIRTMLSRCQFPASDWDAVVAIDSLECSPVLATNPAFLALEFSVELKPRACAQHVLLSAADRHNVREGLLYQLSRSKTRSRAGGILPTQG